MRTNAKLLNPYTGAANIRIIVKNKKKSDGINTAESRPDIELEDKEAGLWLVIDAKHYKSNNIPRKDEMIKDIKCRYKRDPKYAPTVGLMICASHKRLGKKPI